MKKSLIILATLATLALSTAVLFRLCHWHGQHAYTVLSAGLTAIASIMALICSFKGMFTHKALAVITCISILIGSLGIWFKVSHYPGGEVLSLASFGIMIPVCIVWYAVVSWKKH